MDLKGMSVLIVLLTGTAVGYYCGYENGYEDAMIEFYDVGWNSGYIAGFDMSLAPNPEVNFSDYDKFEHSSFMLIKESEYDSNKVMVGYYDFDGKLNYMVSGNISDFEYYNRTLNETEIK